MPGEVYLDLYVLVNGSMDLLCLLLAARLCHAAASRWRLLASAAFGGLYAALALLLGISGIWAILADLLAAFLMTALAFLRRKMKPIRLAKLTFVIFFLSAVLAGLLTLFYRALNRLSLPLESLSGEGLSVWIFALLGGLSGLLTIKGGRFLGYAGKHQEATLVVDFGNGEATLRALIDSGNRLKDPLSGRGVIVAEKNRILPLLPPKQRLLCAHTDPADCLCEGVRLIPAGSATGKALLPALLPKKLLLDDGKERIAVDYLVALSDLGAKGESFDALLPPD